MVTSVVVRVGCPEQQGLYGPRVVCARLALQGHVDESPHDPFSRAAFLFLPGLPLWSSCCWSPLAPARGEDETGLAHGAGLRKRVDSPARTLLACWLCPWRI